jgi:S1-C subfamily serine protease
MSTGRVRRAWLGVAGMPIPLPVAVAERRGQRTGLRVVEVVPGSPAGLAGIYLGDVIVFAGDRPVNGVQDLQRLMLGRAIGARLPITLLRRGAYVDVVAIPEELASR